MSNTNNNMQPQTSSVLHNDIVSSCSTSKVQEKTQISRRRCMNNLREIKSQFKFLTETLQDFGTMPIFKRTFSQHLDLLEQHLTKDILSQTHCSTTLTKLKTNFENAFSSEFKERMQKYTRFNAQSFQDAMICNMDSIGKYMLEIILHQQRTPQLLKQKKLMQTQEDHSNPISALNVDSLKVDLVVIQNTCYEKEDSNSDTTSNKSVNESSLDSTTKDIHAIKYKMSKAKERCMAYFRSLHSHLQVLSKEDLKGTRIKHGFKRAFMSLFGQDHDTFTSTMFLNVDHLQKQLEKDDFQEDGSMKAFWMQTQESKIDMGKAIDVDLVITYSSETESEVQDDNIRSGNDTDADDAYIRPIYDEEPMAESLKSRLHGQILNKESNQAKLKKEIDAYETINIELEHTKNIEQTTSLITQNADLKAQIQEKVFAIAALKNKLRKSKGNSVDTKFAKTSVLGKLVLQSLGNQSVVRQPNAFKSIRPQMSKQRFASQVDMNNNLSKPVTQHYLPKRRESAFAKPDHVIASSESRNSSKNMPRFSSNDMVHNHYLEAARK
ncbi:hypothetical protein Tco_0453178 [Tanacetum coccineum]